MLIVLKLHKKLHSVYMVKLANLLQKMYQQFLPILRQQILCKL